MITLQQSDIEKYIPKRKDDSNKATYGKVLCICGSKDISGAAYLSAKAAYLIGAGMVKVYTHKYNRTIIGSLLPEALISTYEDSYTHQNIADSLSAALKWADVILIGPGLGTSDQSVFIFDYVMNHIQKPIVLDADALNILAMDVSSLDLFKFDQMIITPHMMEMSRLTSLDIPYIKDNKQVVAEAFSSKHNIQVVLKDYHTVTVNTSGECFLNSSGNNGMATAGSGDVLAGIIAGLLAIGVDFDFAGCLGVYIHGLAGDFAAEEKGRYSMLASDILTNIYKVFLKYC